jgi:hypothetical protein
VREVLEETGILTEFVCLAAIREHHKAAFGASDLYVISILKLTDAALACGGWITRRQLCL